MPISVRRDKLHLKHLSQDERFVWRKCIKFAILMHFLTMTPKQCQRYVMILQLRPVQSQKHDGHNNSSIIFLLFQTLFTVKVVVLFHHTRFGAGLRVEWKLDGSHQFTGHCPICVELELHVVRQQRGSYLGKQAVWQVNKTEPLLNHRAPYIQAYTRI